MGLYEFQPVEPYDYKNEIDEYDIFRDSVYIVLNNINLLLSMNEILNKMEYRDVWRLNDVKNGIKEFEFQPFSTHVKERFKYYSGVVDEIISFHKKDIDYFLSLKKL